MITTLNACWKNQITENRLVDILKNSCGFEGYEGQIGMLFHSVSIEEIMRFCLEHKISWKNLECLYKKSIPHGGRSPVFEAWIQEMTA